MDLLFVTGIFRSGTTLLGNVLALHPHVCMAWQPYGPFFRMARNLFALANAPHFDAGRPMGVDWLQDSALQERFLHLFEDLRFDEAQVEQLRRELATYLNQDDADSVNARLKPAGLARRVEALRPGLAGEVFLQLLALLSPPQDSPDLPQHSPGTPCICGCKEVFVEEFVAPLRHTFGSDVRCVHILRDPRAVAYSRNNGQFRAQAGTAYPLAFIAESWNRSAALAQRHQALDQVAVVRYEDLVHAPLDVLLALFHTLHYDVPDLARTLEEGLAQLRTTNSSFAHSGGGVFKASVDRWKEAPAEAAYLEAACAKGMDELGYAPMQHDGPPPPLQEDGTQFPRWLQPYYAPVNTLPK